MLLFYQINRQQSLVFAELQGLMRLNLSRFILSFINILIIFMTGVKKKKNIEIEKLIKYENIFIFNIQKWFIK